jgi:hypothetical protein
MVGKVINPWLLATVSWILISCSSTPATPPCDCSKIKAVEEPKPCAPASAPAPTTDPQLLLMEKQQQLATLQKEIADLKALLQPKDSASNTKDEPEETDKTAKVTKKAPKEADKPAAKAEEKPAEEPKKAPALKLVPR